MYKYICTLCKYNTNKLNNYKQHCNSIKHKKNTDTNESNIYICDYCSKNYKRKHSLLYHKEKCKILYDKILAKNQFEMIQDIKQEFNELKEHNNEIKEELKQELKQEINEIKNKIDPLTEKVNILDHKLDNVKPVVFNLNVFLNNDCKNAISFDELLEQLQYHFDSSKTLTEDTTITLLKSLSTMTVYERPIHCVDVKRNKLYIKDNDKWTKDMTVFNKLPKHATKSYTNYVNNWTESNPEFLEDEDKSYLYNTYTNKEVQEIDTPKIIRKVSKVTTIPKKELTE